MFFLGALSRLVDPLLSSSFLPYLPKVTKRTTPTSESHWPAKGRHVRGSRQNTGTHPHFKTACKSSSNSEAPWNLHCRIRHIHRLIHTQHAHTRTHRTPAYIFAAAPLTVQPQPCSVLCPEEKLRLKDKEGAQVQVRERAVRSLKRDISPFARPALRRHVLPRDFQTPFFLFFFLRACACVCVCVG